MKSIRFALVAGCAFAAGVFVTTLFHSQATSFAQAAAPSPAAEGLPGPATRASGPKALLPSQVAEFAKLAVRSSNVGSRRDLFDNPTITLNNLEAHISTLNPGEISHQPHQHANEEMVIMTEGKLEVYINGKITTAEKGDVLFFSSMDWHNVKSIGTVPAMYYVLNWSAPAKATPIPTSAPASAPARMDGK